MWYNFTGTNKRGDIMLIIISYLAIIGILILACSCYSIEEDKLEHVKYETNSYIKIKNW